MSRPISCSTTDFPTRMLRPYEGGALRFDSLLLRGLTYLLTYLLSPRWVLLRRATAPGLGRGSHTHKNNPGARPRPHGQLMGDNTDPPTSVAPQSTAVLPSCPSAVRWKWQIFFFPIVLYYTVRASRAPWILLRAFRAWSMAPASNLSVPPQAPPLSLQRAGLWESQQGHR